MEQPSATCHVKLVSGGLRHSEKCCSGDWEWCFLTCSWIGGKDRKLQGLQFGIEHYELITLHWWKLKWRFLVKAASDFKMKLFHSDFGCFLMTSPTPKPTTAFRESCSCMDVTEWKGNRTGGNEASGKEKKLKGARRKEKRCIKSKCIWGGTEYTGISPSGSFPPGLPVCHGEGPALPPLEDTLAFNIWVLPYIIPATVKQVLFGKGWERRVQNGLWRTILKSGFILN